jgi:large conductance mechanosensitive channel
VIFILVKGVNAIRRKDAEVPVELPPPTADQVLLGEIRDLLKAR